jgi:O-methyltransferase involved in polyketide biosynthesis
MASRGSEAVSPTAHYTGYVWARNGLSHPRLQTREGRLLFESLRPVMALSDALGGASLEHYLLTRHRAIDLVLSRAIEAGEIGAVIELAAGLSPRGWRFHRRHGERLDYVETDLEAMSARKREALDEIGCLSERHRVQTLDALRHDGPLSLAEAAASLDHERGLAIVCEGLLGYLESAAVLDLWRRCARELGRFPSGLFVCDLHLGEVQSACVHAFRVLLSAFVRGRVHLHFDSAAQARRALIDAGFADAAVHRGGALLDGTGRSARLVHIIEASTTRSP